MKVELGDIVKVGGQAFEVHGIMQHISGDTFYINETNNGFVKRGQFRKQDIESILKYRDQQHEVGDKIIVPYKAVCEVTMVERATLEEGRTYLLYTLKTPRGNSIVLCEWQLRNAIRDCTEYKIGDRVEVEIEYDVADDYPVIQVVVGTIVNFKTLEDAWDSGSIKETYFVKTDKGIVLVCTKDEIRHHKNERRK